MPCRGDAAALSPPAWSEGPWEDEVQQMGEGSQGSVRDILVRLTEMGASESVLGILVLVILNVIHQGIWLVCNLY